MCVPSKFAQSPPTVFISSANELLLSIRSLYSDYRIIEAKFKRIIDEIKQWLEWSKYDIHKFNEPLKKTILDLLEKKKNLHLKNQTMLESMGWP